MNFTGSTYEYMMQHNNSTREKREEAGKTTLPLSHPCYGCSYAVSAPCIGYCMKKLTQKKKGMER